MAEAVRSHWRTGMALLAVGLLDVVLCMSCRETGRRPSIPKIDAALDGPPLVRVEIASGPESVDVEVNGPYRIVLDSTGRQASRGKQLQRTTVRPAPDGLLFGNQRLRASQLSIVPALGHTVGVGSRRYRGSVTVHRTAAAALRAVNVIDVDTMLASVVGAEMPSRWPMAALKAQAVAGRTFLLYRKAARHDKTVHVSRHDVRYLGVERETARARCAADETRGVVLVYDQRLLPAYFMATCGGRTTSVSDAFGEPQIPPLSGVACGYCEDSTTYTWKRQFGKDDIAERLGFAPGEAIRSIRPFAGASGYADHVVVDTNSGKHTFSAYRFRVALGPDRLKSAAFAVADTGRSFTFVGRGWGHGVGLCQWGARGMAHAHFDWPSILSHFFPQSQLVRIY